MAIHTLDGDDGRPNVPLVRLEPEDSDDFFYSTSEEDGGWHGDLSPITERTELTEYSSDWPLPAEPAVVEHEPPMSSAASTSDYGNVIGKPQQISLSPLRLNAILEHSLPEDPNNIPPSPTLSALQRLSILEPPPSASSTGSRTPTQETVALPPPLLVEDPPVDPPAVPPKPSLRSLARKSESKSSLSTVRAAATPPRSQSPQQTQPLPTDNEPQRPKSKLSALASSRSSVTSRSSVLSEHTAVTYPNLRPSSFSAAGVEEDAKSEITTSSSMSSHVRKAIEAALLLEAADSTPKAQTQELPLSPSRTVSAARSSVARDADPSPSVTQTSPRPTTQAPAPQSPPVSEGKPKVSKLAQLAQAKAQQSQGPWMPKPKRPRAETPTLMMQKPHTEYLTPIANGPTATTAITTTYQSLASLARPSRSEPKPQGVVDMFAPKRSPTEPKHSKLALKSKKAHKAHDVQPEPEPEPALSALDLPMFTTMNVQSRASPSAFASVLLSDEIAPIEAKPSKAKDKESARAREHREVTEKPRKKSHKRNEVLLPPGPRSSSEGFAFDVPSPDDVVFNARRGTSLGHRSSSTTTHLPPSTHSVSSSRTTVSSRS